MDSSAFNEDIARVAAAIRDAGPALDPARTAARYFADDLRKVMPEIDEVIVGRVLLYAAAYAGVMAADGRDAVTIGNVFTLAGIDMAAEIVEEP